MQQFAIAHGAAADQHSAHQQPQSGRVLTSSHRMMQQFVQPHRLTCDAYVDHAGADKRSDCEQQSVAGVQAIESATHRHVGKL